MKSLLLSLLLVVSGTCMSQVKVETKETKYLYLLTATYEIIEPEGMYKSDTITYYSRTLRAGYDYPSILEGYFRVAIFERIDGLVDFYTELANLENKEDGTYELSMRVEKDGAIHAIKTGSKIKLTNNYNLYKYGRYKMDDIKTDLALLKSMLNR
jgi:hypothetical protein